MPLLRVRFVLLLAACYLFVGSSAQAFYWRGWPGSGTTSTATTTTTTTYTARQDSTSASTPTTGGTGSTDGDKDPGEDDEKDPGDDDPIVEITGAHLPEPSTLLAALIGMGTVGLVRRFANRS